jgi:hypothetical protein
MKTDVLAPFWEGNAASMESGGKPDCAGQPPVESDSNRLLAVLNVAMADTAITIWSSKRFYGAAMPVEVTWRPATSIPLARDRRNPDTAPDPSWAPLVTTPSHRNIRPGIPVSTALLRRFSSPTSSEIRRLH